MNSDEVLRNMPADMKFFVYRTATLAYSPETGMCWRVNSRNGNWSLITPGTVNGYTVLGIEGKLPRLHRIIAEVFLNAGKPLAPQQDVDHAEQVDGSHWQDRLSNLRICSHSENLQNQKLSSRNTSGFKGVCWNKPAGKWRAMIQLHGKRQHLGLFTTPEAAAEAYDKAALRHYGDFALTNAKLGLFNPRKLIRGLIYATQNFGESPCHLLPATY